MIAHVGTKGVYGQIGEGALGELAKLVGVWVEYCGKGQDGFRVRGIMRGCR